MFNSVVPIENGENSVLNGERNRTFDEKLKDLLKPQFKKLSNEKTVTMFLLMVRKENLFCLFL